jgi:hypothetical protein
MSQHAAGSFEVKLAPIASHDPGAAIGRFSLDKQYAGDLVASASGEMLSVMGGVQGSAVYVAIERVSGRLNGREGSFALHHRGVMTRGAPELVVTISPDSGTGGLTGIAGTMTIEIRGRDHFYTIDYELPES